MGLGTRLPEMILSRDAMAWSSKKVCEWGRETIIANCLQDMHTTHSHNNRTRVMRIHLVDNFELALCRTVGTFFVLHCDCFNKIKNRQFQCGRGFIAIATLNGINN